MSFSPALRGYACGAPRSALGLLVENSLIAGRHNDSSDRRQRAALSR